MSNKTAFLSDRKKQSFMAIIPLFAMMIFELDSNNEYI